MKKILIISAVVLVLVAVLGAVWYFSKKNKPAVSTTEDSAGTVATGVDSKAEALQTTPSKAFTKFVETKKPFIAEEAKKAIIKEFGSFPAGKAAN